MCTLKFSGLARHYGEKDKIPGILDKTVYGWDGPGMQNVLLLVQANKHSPLVTERTKTCHWLTPLLHLELLRGCHFFEFSVFEY